MSHLTKKNFEAIAATLRHHKANNVLIADMANVLERTNPSFDRQRFINAATAIPGATK